MLRLQQRRALRKRLQRKRKTQALIEAINKIEPIDVDDLESLYSLDDEPREKTVCSIFYPGDSDDESAESSDSDYPKAIYMAQPLDRHIMTPKPTHTVTHVSMAQENNWETVKETPTTEKAVDKPPTLKIPAPNDKRILRTDGGKIQRLMDEDNSVRKSYGHHTDTNKKAIIKRRPKWP